MESSTQFDIIMKTQKPYKPNRPVLVIAKEHGHKK